MAGGAGGECGGAGDGAVRDLAVWVLSGDRGCGCWCGIEGAGGAAAGGEVEDARVGCARGGGGRRLAIGHADGLRRELSATNAKPGGWAMVRGGRAGIVGRVSMNLTMVDV